MKILKLLEKINNTNPENVRIIFDFLNNIPGLELSSPKARARIDLGPEDFEVADPQSINRYKVIKRKFFSLNLGKV